jgi:hypothetical protein
MLHLFLGPTPFDAWHEYPYRWTTLSQLLPTLMVIASVGGLVLAVCRILLMLLADQCFELPDQEC